MSFTEVIAALPRMTIAERQQLVRRALELDNRLLSSADEALVESLGGASRQASFFRAVGRNEKALSVWIVNQWRVVVRPEVEQDVAEAVGLPLSCLSSRLCLLASSR